MPWCAFSDGEAESELVLLGWSQLVENSGRHGIRANGSYVRCDVNEFRALHEQRRYAQALAIYQGDFLAALHVSGLPDFQRWLDAERAALRLLAQDAALQLAAAATQESQLHEALFWASKAEAISPHDERTVSLVIALQSRTGNLVGALQKYRSFERLLAAEYHLEASDSMREQVSALRVARER